MSLPSLRNLDAFPIEYEGEQFICLRDPEGIIEEQVMLSPKAFVVAALLDGRRTMQEVQYAFAKQFQGELIRSEEVQEVVEALDRVGMLQSSAFDSIRMAVEDAFAREPVRSAYLAGKSYPDNEMELRNFLDAQFVRDGGPGELPESSEPAGDPLRCLIVPHIDFPRGGHSYAYGYREMAQRTKPSVAYVFGVAHTGPPVPFVLIRKDFETPFGTIHTDGELVDELASVCEWDPYQHQIVHRTEHSIEFQVIMLSYLFGPDVRIVPVLCGSFGDEDTHPDEQKRIQVFLDTAIRRIESLKGEATVIAGVDLAHVGRRFGDPFTITKQVLHRVEQRDREDLKAAMEGRAGDFYSSVMQDGNARRVCGLNAIYAALKTAQPGEGNLLHYGYASDPAGGIVSFASIAYD